MRITALSGGVGGAKLVDGLCQILQPGELTVIVNTGDDFIHYGLHICPDLDTVCYTLAGISNPEHGWGVKDESWQALKSASLLGGPAWFNLGDKDLGTHLERTRRLALGDPLSTITADFCKKWGIASRVLPMTDGQLMTVVITPEGDELPFQEYFVKNGCEPVVSGFKFIGADRARPALGVIDAINDADAVIICPSNPWVSIDPILSLPAIEKAVLRHPLVIGVSPIIQGKAIKGPAAKMFMELGVDPSPVAVAKHYGNILKYFFVDDLDMEDVPAISKLGIITYNTNTWMQSRDDRAILAGNIIETVRRNKNPQ